MEGVVDDNAWRGNFCMSNHSLITLTEELCPYIKGEITNMNTPVGVLKKVVVLFK